MSEGRGFRTICVAGGGIVALSAALAFARALPRTKVTLLALPVPADALADRLPGTLADVHLFHAAVGVNELDLVRSGIATHRLGTRFERWSAGASPWYHAFGEHGRPTGGVAFHHLWLRAHRAGRARPYHAYSMAAALADAGKFVHPVEDGRSPLSTFLSALRLDPQAYAGLLAERAAKLARVEGELGEVECRPDGGVAALRLKDGRRIEADLFVDCAGPEAPVLSALDPEFEDWSEWLPCDLIALGPADTKLTSCDLVEAETAGWRWIAPHPRSPVKARLTASAFEAGARGLSIRRGRRPRPWVRNVLALGDSATSVDPLHQCNLHLAQRAILLALELLPGRDCHSLELAEYNRRSGQRTLRVRDFLALHYLRSGRRDGDLWREMASREPPDSLARTLEQFEARGRLPFHEEESFEPEAWLAALLGLGILPRAAAPASTGVDPHEAAEAMERLAGEIAAITSQAPAYDDYLSRMQTTPARC